MGWVVCAATTAIAATLWLPVEAAPPAAPAASTDAISFEQYRDWRLGNYGVDCTDAADR
jgi:hypothetical protein